jgi:hypothetical protein
MPSVRQSRGFTCRVAVALLVAILAACGGASAEQKRSQTAKSEGQGGERDDDSLKPVPVGAVHPNRVGSRSYSEEYYEPTIIPPKGAAESDRQ